MEEGYAVGPIDGIYGPLTQQAVVQYQRDNDLRADGIIGYETFEEMADSGIIDEAGETFDDVGNEIDETVDDAGEAIDTTVDDVGNEIDETVDDPEQIDDGLFDEDGVFDDDASDEDEGIFDNEGQFDNEDDGIL
ncbi:MAG: peptidoglycan-binding protein [Elainellaceae cyanobacterium]